jgi:hypothetical protein
MTVVRRVLAALLAIAAIVVWFALKPSDGISQRDDRIPAELALGVLGIALLIGTSSRRPAETNRATFSLPLTEMPGVPEATVETASHFPVGQQIDFTRRIVGQSRRRGAHSVG